MIKTKRISSYNIIGEINTDIISKIQYIKNKNLELTEFSKRPFFSLLEVNFGFLVSDTEKLFH